MAPKKRDQNKQPREDEGQFRVGINDSAHRESVWEAQEFLRDFVKARWGEYWHSVTFNCDLTIVEVRGLGYLPESEGTKACQQLVRVPVINEEIGSALWRKLSTDAGSEKQAALEANKNAQESEDTTISPKPSVASKDKDKTRKDNHTNNKQKQNQKGQTKKSKPTSTCYLCGAAFELSSTQDDSQPSKCGACRKKKSSKSSLEVPWSRRSQDKSPSLCRSISLVSSRSSIRSISSSTTSSCRFKKIAILEKVSIARIQEKLCSLGESLTHGYGN